MFSAADTVLGLTISRHVILYELDVSPGRYLNLPPSTLYYYEVKADIYFRLVADLRVFL